MEEQNPFTAVEIITGTVRAVIKQDGASQLFRPLGKLEPDQSGARKIPESGILQDRVSPQFVIAENVRMDFEN